MEHTKLLTKLLNKDKEQEIENREHFDMLPLDSLEGLKEFEQLIEDQAVFSKVVSMTSDCSSFYI